LAGPVKADTAAIMAKYAFKIEYDGTGFAGWQRQKDVPSVQGVVEDALGKVQTDAVTITAAGRTDAGVHATGQVAHVEMSRTWDPARLTGAVNFHMQPHSVAIVDCAEVDSEFSARFSAVHRTYRFRILTRRAPLTHLRNLVWRVGHELDVDAMQEAANHLIGHHDFTTFRSTQCQSNSPVKSLDRLDVSRRETRYGPEVEFVVGARSFLHNQVRSFVGTLERVGAGSWAPERVRNALEAADRAACGPVCPPQGLYLERVDYPMDPFG